MTRQKQLHVPIPARFSGLPNRKRRRTSFLVESMSLSLIAVAALAFWDEERESAAALEDFALEQATLARSLAAGLRARLSQARQDALLAAEDGLAGRPISPRIAERYLALRVKGPEQPAPPRSAGRMLEVEVPASQGRRVFLTLTAGSLLDETGMIERPGSLMLLVLPPDRQVLYTADGRVLTAPRILEALQKGQSYVRLSRDDAARLGLSARTAMAGLARVEGGVLGQWGVAAVASVERQRDRERRARWRLVFGVLLASGLVLAFGGAALRKQRKELELERELTVAEILKQRDDRLVQASRVATMGTLAMGITHELSTPLGVIAGRAEQLMDRAAGDDRATRGLQAILEQVGHINQVVRGFLELARGGNPQIQPIEPACIVADALLLVEHRFARVGVELVPIVASELPCLHGDPRLLEHALVNLLLNACDACEPGGRVQVEVRQGRRDIIFSVTDNGTGFSPDGVARALEPFFSTKPAEKGTGLGLAVANEIVKSHRGELVIEPIAPHGTRASIHIPLPEDRPGAKTPAEGGLLDA